MTTNNATNDLTCPDCNFEVEPTPSGMYRHLRQITGYCGFRLISDALRADGTMTSEDPEITINLIDVCPSPRPSAKGWIPGHVKLDAPPTPGMKVQIVSRVGTHTYGTGTVVESPWVLGDPHPVARLRTLQKSFRVVSDWTEERYGKQVPMMIFDVEYRLTDPVNVYDVTREQAFDLLPEWAQAGCVRTPAK